MLEGASVSEKTGQSPGFFVSNFSCLAGRFLGDFPLTILIISEAFDSEAKSFIRITRGA